MKKIAPILLLIFIIISCKKVKPKEYYSIKGKIENFNGNIYLTKALFDDEYYFDNSLKDSVLVSDGKFEFRLSTKNNFPLPFYIETDKTKTSHFILEPKDQQIIIDSLYYNVFPKIICKNSTIQKEQLILKERISIALEKFKTEFKKIKSPDFPKDSIEKSAINAREKLTFESNLILKEFAKDYPNSFVSFWKIAMNIQYNGYNEELENAYNNLSTTIKQSKVSNVLLQNILKAKTFKIGNHFPIIKLKNKELNEIVLNVTENSKADYSLVDFWFSNCGPCIAQFPKLKELHSKYNPKQFNIISISTDKTKDIDNWYKIMEQKNMTWPNLLDENGTKSSTLGIVSFPTNYLLNKKGIIIKKNISLIELEKLFEKAE
ncbi:thiol-disulfide isomerase/thioredoxin [Saonia flava]|uniref:Thiol-disulfide isomerase/thioredoxin n=1 Tax=Saonia flava TaxID=523696 RepID=A0A846R4D0_9FLAO|nr:TlpA disulfide reductase family protein [Saonia flava]NJB72224.1 thiol-disulfide isomerase/thioredoxin [Saonia flava]